jgi:hypothetical protein
MLPTLYLPSAFDALVAFERSKFVIKLSIGSFIVRVWTEFISVTDAT